MNSNRSPRTPLSHTPRLLFLQHASIFESYGGIEYYLDDLASLCAEIYGQSNVCALISSVNEVALPEGSPYRAEFLPLRHQGVWRKVERRFSLAYFQRALTLTRQLQPTLLVCTHVSLGPLAFLLSRATKIPFVTCAYGIECWGKLWPQDELSLRAADGILSISHWTKGVLAERGYEEEKIAIIQPRLATVYEKLPAPQKKARPNEPLRLLTVSRLDTSERYKGHDHVIEALALLHNSAPDIPFQYVIQGDGSDRRRLEGISRQHGLEERIEFRGAVKNREALEEAYAEADLFVMPSRFGQWERRWRGEGFGIVYLEAAAFGLPSVAYRCGGATDIIRNRVNGMLVDPDNIEQLARTLLHLAKDRELVRQLGERAYEMVMKNFTRQAIGKQVRKALSGFAE